MVGVEFAFARVEFARFWLGFAFILKVKGEAKFLSLSLSLSRLHCFESLSFGRFG